MEKLPEIAFSAPPFIIGYALQVESLAAAEQAVDNAGLEWHAFEDGIAAAFPSELGEGRMALCRTRLGACRGGASAAPIGKPALASVVGAGGAWLGARYSQTFSP